MSEDPNENEYENFLTEDDRNLADHPNVHVAGRVEDTNASQHVRRETAKIREEGPSLEMSEEGEVDDPLEIDMEEDSYEFTTPVRTEAGSRRVALTMRIQDVLDEFDASLSDIADQLHPSIHRIDPERLARALMTLDFSPSEEGFGEYETAEVGDREAAIHPGVAQLAGILNCRVSDIANVGETVEPSNLSTSGCLWIRQFDEDGGDAPVETDLVFTSDPVSVEEAVMLVSGDVDDSDDIDCSTASPIDPSDRFVVDLVRR